MKKSVAMKWIKALRSGKYKQTKKVLWNEKGYCCLGVLCKIAPKKMTLKKHNESDNENLDAYPKVKEWADIFHPDGRLPDDVFLSTMNDEGKSFEQIANAIEKHWSSL